MTDRQTDGRTGALGDGLLGHTANYPPVMNDVISITFTKI